MHKVTTFVMRVAIIDIDESTLGACTQCLECAVARVKSQVIDGAHNRSVSAQASKNVGLPYDFQIL